jgi:hypothetical protein
MEAWDPVILLVLNYSRLHGPSLEIACSYKK